jgi:hypothetical protein
VTDEQKRWAENLLHRYRTRLGYDHDWDDDAFGLLRELMEPDNHNTIAAAPHFRERLKLIASVDGSAG